MPKRLKKEKETQEIKLNPSIEPVEISSLQKNSSNINFILVGLLVVASFLLGMLFTKVQYLQQGQQNITAQPTTAAAAQPNQPQQPQAPKISLATIKGLFNKDLIKFGDDSKKLLFVEIADPSCPYCHAAAGLNPELNRQMGDRFKLISDGGTYDSPVIEMRKLVDSGQASFVYIYQNGHGNGEMAMKALYCANDQGKFWQTHDKLMTNAGYNLINTEVKNDKSQVDKLTDYLNDVVDATNLQSCILSGKYDNRLTSDAKLGQELGASGTPGFFINSNFFAGAYNWTDMKSAAEKGLK